MQVDRKSLLSALATLKPIASKDARHVSGVAVLESTSAGVMAWGDNLDLRREVTVIGAALPGEIVMLPVAELLTGLRKLTGSTVELISIPVEVTSEERVPDPATGSMITRATVYHSTSTTFVCGAFRLDLEDLPAVADLPPRRPIIGRRFDFDATVLLRALEAVRYAISTDMTRPSLNGVHLRIEGKSATFTTSDGHRLARHVTVMPLKTKRPLAVLIPTAGVSELIKMIAGHTVIVTALADGTLAFETDDQTLFVRLIDEAAPQWEHVIGTRKSGTAYFDRQELLDAVVAVSAWSGPKQPTIALLSDGGRLAVTLKNGERKASSEIDAQLLASKLDLWVNGRYLIDALSKMADGTCMALFSDQYGPIMFSSPDETHLVMPMRQH